MNENHLSSKAGVLVEKHDLKNYTFLHTPSSLLNARY